MGEVYTDSLGSEATLSIVDGYHWWIKSIRVPVKYRGSGLGSALLDHICQDADVEPGITLYLTPSPSVGGPLDRSQLEDWYRRHGFETGEEPHVLVRRPSGQD